MSTLAIWCQVVQSRDVSLHNFNGLAMSGLAFSVAPLVQMFSWFCRWKSLKIGQYWISSRVQKLCQSFWATLYCVAHRHVIPNLLCVLSSLSFCQAKVVRQLEGGGTWRRYVIYGGYVTVTRGIASWKWLTKRNSPNVLPNYVSDSSQQKILHIKTYYTIPCDIFQGVFFAAIIFIAK